MSHKILSDVIISGKLSVSESISANVFFGDGSNLLGVITSISGYSLTTEVESISSNLQNQIDTLAPLSYVNNLSANLDNYTLLTNSESISSNLQNQLNECVKLSGDQNINGNKIFNQDVTVGGNLFVQGATVTVNSENVLIKDNILTLNTNLSGNPDNYTPNGGGIEINRGDLAPAQILFNETSNSWQYGISGALYDFGSISNTQQSALNQKANINAPAFTGDATFDTDVLKIDSVNDRIGIGTTPNSRLHVLSPTPTSSTLDLVVNISNNIDSDLQISVTGNSSTDKRAQIGSGTNTALALITNNTERMRIDSSGKVGIGTDAPKMELHVTDAGGMDGSSTELVLRSGLYYDGADKFLRATGKASQIVQDANGETIFYRSSNSSSGVASVATMVESMRIDPSGKIGIGTPTPEARLHLAQNTAGAISNIIVSGDDGTSDGGAGLVLRRNNITQWHMFHRNATSPLYFSTGEGDSGASKLTIKQDGKVGIGTINAPTKLSIRGTTDSVDSTFQIVANGISSFLLGCNSVGTHYRSDTGVHIFRTGGDGDTKASDGTERVRIDTNGIKFNGTDTRYALGNYDAWTWIPSVGGTATYTLQSGYYTRIGDICFISLDISISSIGTGSTTVISGLPFTASSALPTGGFCAAVNVGYFNNIASNLVGFALSIDSGTNAITIRSMTSAASNPSDNTIFQNGSRMAITGFYKVA